MTIIPVMLKACRLPFIVSGGVDRVNILANGIPIIIPTMAVTAVIEISLGVVSVHQLAS